MSGALTRWSEQDEQKNLASVTPFGRWRAESFDRLIFQHPANYALKLSVNRATRLVRR